MASNRDLTTAIVVSRGAGQRSSTKVPRIAPWALADPFPYAGLQDVLRREFESAGGTFTRWAPAPSWRTFGSRLAPKRNYPEGRKVADKLGASPPPFRSRTKFR